MVNNKATTSKETVYVDVDDEITNIIEKVKAADKKIVALVLPKRAAVMQSVVNMKLLKKAAASANKNVVLITAESALMPLAGVAGLHVAKSPQSKPSIPPAPKERADDDEEPETVKEETDNELDPKASIGTLAAAAAKDDDDTETIELDNINLDTPPAAGTAAKKPSKLKHLKVPNFEKFRNRFFLAGLGLVLLIFGWFLAFVVMPKATITIRTDTSTVVSSFDFTASADQEELNIEDKIIPATLKEVNKTDSEKVPATGERDDGTKASGEVTLKLTNCSKEKVTVPEGTTITSGDTSFIIQDDATMESVEIGGNCRNDDFPGISSETVEVLAAENGDRFNLGSGSTFSVSGFSSVSGTNSDNFSGGTSKIVKIVAQNDIDKALAKIKGRVDASAKDELALAIESDNLFPLNETLLAGEPKITASPKLNTEAEEVTVSSEILYSMLGVNREDLSMIIKDDVQEDIDTEKQEITNDGIDRAVMNISNQPSGSEALVTFRSSVTAGPEINQSEIKEAVRGKKRGEVEKYIDQIPGVEEVTVDYSPFWVYSTPKATKKITVNVEKSNEEQQPQANDE